MQAHINQLEKSLAAVRENSRKIKNDYVTDKRLAKLEATQTD